MIVDAVIVTHEPDHVHLRQLADRLGQSCRTVYVVDNGSAEPPRSAAGADTGNVLVIENGRNLGLAAGLNAGIRASLSAGSDAVLLLDQDSMPANEMIAKLSAALETLTAQRRSIAAIGPVIRDARLGRDHPVRRTEGWHLRTSAIGAENARAVDYVLTSGSLLPRAAIETAGLMREDMFIDWVDIEWGLRARFRHGLDSFCVTDAVLDHRLGEVPARFAGRRFSARQATRHYYMVRNAFALWRQPWLPRAWVLRHLPETFARFGRLALTGRPYTRNLAAMAGGLRDGLSGRMGPYHG
jgi:rhamnosyltransferase